MKLLEFVRVPRASGLLQKRKRTGNDRQSGARWVNLLVSVAA